MRRLLSFSLLLWAVSAGAQVDPVVRVAATPATVRVGEALSLRVTVLVPTWFPRPPVYPDFEVANAITRLPPDSAFPTSERIDGESWSGIVWEYRVYPLVEGSYRIDGASLRVTYANPGADPVVRDVALPPVAFRGSVPVGAEGLAPYLAGRDLAVSLTVQGGDGELAVGDAVVLTYVATLDGLPSMFLPPLAPALEGLVEAGSVSLYADAPRFRDGDGLAIRSERVTLVFQAPGDFTVPEVALDYWDTAAGAVHTARVEAVEFSVSGAAAAGGVAGEAAEGGRRGWLPLLAGLPVVMAVAGYALLPALRRRLALWRRSEPRAFRDLRRALRSASGPEQYRAVLRWLSRLAPGLSPRSFARDYGDATLRDALDALGAHCFGGRNEPLAPHRLERALVQARRRYRRRARRRYRGVALAPLNP